MENTSKVSRVLEIYNKLINGYLVSKAVEAQMYGVDERTIQRDIDDIRDYMEQSSVDSGILNFVVYDRIEKGKVQYQGTLKKALRRIIRDCNDWQLDKSEKVLLPAFSCHSLRHTYTTRLVEAGVNLKVVQSVFGHADFSTTMDVYTTVTNELKQREFDSLQEKMKQRKNTQSNK